MNLLRRRFEAIHHLLRALTVVALLAIALAFTTTSAQAAIRHVRLGGTDSGDCTLSGTPCATITYALSVAADNDEIKVAEGTYSEPQITVNKAVIITGGFDPDGPTLWNSSNYTFTPTILDGGGTHRLFHVPANSAVLQFMTIVNGNATGAASVPDAGGGIVISNAQNVILRGLKLQDNVASTTSATSTGGGIAIVGASKVAIERSIILSNTTTGLGGGIGITPATGQVAEVRVDSSVIAHNAAAIGGGAIAASDDGRTILSLYYMTLADNDAGAATEAVYLTNGSNTAGSMDSLQFNYTLVTGNPTLLNSMTDLVPSVFLNGLMADPSVTLPYDGNVPGGTAQPIFATLNFVNPDKGNYHLPEGSPAIDIAGNTTKVDLEGRTNNVIATTNCTPYTLCPLGLGDDYGAYEYIYTAPSVRYVAKEGNDNNNNCLNQALPCRTLGNASSLALGGDEIRVARGNYADSDNNTPCNNGAVVCIRQGITLTGGYTLTNWTTPSPNPSLTVLDGSAARQVIRVDYDAPTGSTLLQNFVATNGVASGHCAGIAVNGQNVGPTQNVTIRNCRVENNHGTGDGDGGGIFAKESPNLRITGCTISGNSVADGRGGGLAFTDATGSVGYTFTNLDVFNNFAGRKDETSANGGMGGGIFLQGIGTLRQSEVYSNSAEASGGGVTTGSNNSDPLIDRVKIHDNQASIGGGFSIFLTGGATLQNSLLARNVATSTLGILTGQTSELMTGGNAIHSPYIGLPNEPLHIINVTIADNRGAVGDAIRIEGNPNAAASRVNSLTNVLISGSQVGIRSDGEGVAELTKVLITNDVITKTDNFDPARLTGSIPLTGAVGYVDPGDYHLLPTAEGVDDGDTVAGVTQDLDGTARPIGPAYDIGAYETTKAKLNQTITFVKPGDRALANSPFDVAPSASSGLSVTVTSLTPSICTVSDFTVTLRAIGTCTLEATQPGDAQYNPAPAVQHSFRVTTDTPEARLLMPALKNE